MNPQLHSVTPAVDRFWVAAPTAPNLNIQLIVFDESRYYADRVLELAGKVFQVYAYDSHRPTHCCETTPSFESHPVATQALNCPDSEDERDALDEMLRSTQQEPIFMHCRVVQSTSSLFRRAHYECDRDGEEEYDTQLESALERIRCNPPCVLSGRQDCVLA
jgi:hypothetical protein